MHKAVYFPNGETYAGSWKKNLRHGKGCLVYKNGAKYEGDWSNGVRHGLGTLWTYRDGKYRVSLVSRSNTSTRASSATTRPEAIQRVARPAKARQACLQ